LQKQHDSTLQQSSKDEELLRSVKEGLTPRVRHLLQTGADIDCQDNTGLSALHIAVATGFEDVVDLLLQKGADINALHPTAGTPLCLATNKERSHIIRKLIAARADINRASHQGATPLHWASFHGDVGLLTSLLSSGARPLAVVDVRCMDGETPATTKTCPRKYARSPLGLAAERGYVECTRILCQYGGVDSNAYQHGLGPLFYACLKVHPECVDLLLQQGVDPNERVFLEDGRADSQSSIYVILLAMQRIQAQGSILYSLIDAKTRTDVRGGDGTSIARIVLCYHRGPSGHRRVLSFLPAGPTGKPSHSAFADKVKRVMELARTASLSFSLRRDLAVFEKHVVFTAASTSANHLSDLLDLGADIDVTDYTGSTAHLAVTVGHSEATELLLGKGARSDVHRNVEGAPLWEAISKRDYEVAGFLLHHGADPNIVNSDGQTPLHLAASQGHVEMIKALVKAGASVSARDHWCQTPLHLTENKPSAEILMNLGADPSTSRDMPVQTFTKTREGVARVLVLGSTGSGKTTFINALARSTLPVFHGPESCTAEIDVVQSRLRGYGAEVEVDVIDTPGWGDPSMEYESLQSIRRFLADEYRAKKRLRCVLYMINVREVGSDPHMCRKVVKELVGHRAIQCLNFVFTHGTEKISEDADRSLDQIRQEESERIEEWKERILPPEAKKLICSF
jgi:ankyrin repeat protein/GTP-binding protein EngB required for normal cell division